MNYFGQSEKAYLNLKQQERAAFREREDFLQSNYTLGFLTAQAEIEYFFLVLATRIYRAKFFSLPAYTNEELAYMIGCSSGTYLGLIATRQKDCSADMAIQMSEKLKELEMAEGMQPIFQPPYPGRQ